MKVSRALFLMVFLAGLVGDGAQALGSRPGGPGQESLPAALEQAGEEQAEEAAQEAARLDQVGAAADAAASDLATLPPVNIDTTDEQERALRLVETILAEQRLLLSGQNFVYQAGGRRDPFRSLLAARQRELLAPELRPAGLAGFLISEIRIAATASYQGRWQAMIVGLDQRTYFVVVGAVLYDGRVVEISGDEVIFEQEVEDLLGARSKHRVAKRLVTDNQEY